MLANITHQQLPLEGESFQPEVIPITFEFNPWLSTNSEIREVFQDPLARVVWCGVKRNHLVDQYFNRGCLNLAKELQKRKRLTGSQLNRLLSAYGLIGWGEQGVGDKLLPFIIGVKQFQYLIPEVLER